MITALGMVAVLLGAGGAWFTRDFVERASDRVLTASVSAIAETVSLERDHIRVEVPAVAFSALENSRRDNVYYNVYGEGRIITGYDELTVPPATEMQPSETYFRYGKCRGQTVRIATQVRRLPGLAEPVVIQVAETLQERWSLSSQMLIGLAVLELLLVGIAALLVWPAVRWGLRPVTSLQREMADRRIASADVSPLSTSGVPAELRQLVEGFNQLLQRLEHVLSGLRQFTADASHQMRTPIATLRAQLAVLKSMGLENDDQRECFSDIEESCNRLERLLSQLLQLARAEDAAALGDQVRSIDLVAVAANVAREIAPSAVAAKIEINFEHDGKVEALANKAIIIEILSNLIDNAVRYNEPGGHVEVRVYRKGGAPTVEIEDDGPGIPDEELEKVFQRFYRLKSHQNASGSGLGLPIVRSLCLIVGASLTLNHGSNGRGLIARVTFPPKIG